jgi:predicted RND superfamily exporter protein
MRGIYLRLKIIYICTLKNELAVCQLSQVDVGGFMHFWGLTIDVISCVNLVIAVGLCVDYAAHIVHCFLLQTGQ